MNTQTLSLVFHQSVRVSGKERDTRLLFELAIRDMKTGLGCFFLELDMVGGRVFHFIQQSGGTNITGYEILST